jgi:hypothetical protein
MMYMRPVSSTRHHNPARLKTAAGSTFIQLVQSLLETHTVPIPTEHLHHAHTAYTLLPVSLPVPLLLQRAPLVLTEPPAAASGPAAPACPG